MADASLNLPRRRMVQGLLAAGATAGCTQRDRPETLIEDVSRIDATRVAQVLRPSSTVAVATALTQTHAPVSIGGARYSMGGQVVEPGSLHLDMRAMNRLVHLDVAQRRVRVQAGMRWRDLQDRIDRHDLAVKVMQSYSNFSVGGSVSVNCHGRYVGRGALVNTVRALQLVAADGRVLELGRDTHPQLFGAVIGGYGGLGVVTEVELDLDANRRIERHVERIGLDEYPAYFRERVLADPDAVLHNADLTPPGFDAPLAITWRHTDAALTEPARLTPRGLDYDREQNLIWAASELPGSAGVRDRYMTQQLMQDPAVIWRNREASLDTAALEPRTRMVSTYLLQEYFIPVPAFASFARTLAALLRRYEVNALNVSIRHAPADTTSLLRWAPAEVFSFVLYHKQRNTHRADRNAQGWTRAIIDAALEHGGRYYLPYRLHATPQQFQRAYPESVAFAAIKREWDPQNRFRNRLWDRYLPR